MCDPSGRLYALMLTGGQAHDIWGARVLLASVATPAGFLNDKAYDAGHIRDYLAANGGEAIIPSKVNRGEPRPHDANAYKKAKHYRTLFLPAEELERHRYTL